MISLSLHTEGLLSCCYVCLQVVKNRSADNSTQSVLPLANTAKTTFLLCSKTLSSLPFPWPQVITVLSPANMSSHLTMQIEEHVLPKCWQHSIHVHAATHPAPPPGLKLYEIIRCNFQYLDLTHNEAL